MEYIVRHFILAKDFKLNNDAHMFSAKNIYEYFQAKKYPAYIDMKAVIGICFFNPNHIYNIEIKVTQKNTLLGRWDFANVDVEKPNEILNISFGTKGKLIIPEQGFVQFDIFVDGQKINTQVIQAVVQEGD